MTRKAFSLRRRWHSVSCDGCGGKYDPTSVSCADSLSPGRSLGACNNKYKYAIKQKRKGEYDYGKNPI
jgi:hypothetical protein